MSKIKDHIDTLHSTDVYLPTRTIFLTGDISEKTYESTIKNLHALDNDGADTVTIYINSDGGNVMEGMAIYDAIKAMKCMVRGIVWGQASSIASVIFLACDERIMTPHSAIMIHDGSGTTMPSSPKQTQRNWLKHDDYMDEKVCKIYLDKIKAVKPRFSKNKLQELLSHDTILSAKEAVKLGLADRIEEVI